MYVVFSWNFCIVTTRVSVIMWESSECASLYEQCCTSAVTMGARATAFCCEWILSTKNRVMKISECNEIPLRIAATVDAAKSVDRTFMYVSFDEYSWSIEQTMMPGMYACSLACQLSKCQKHWRWKERIVHKTRNLSTETTEMSPVLIWKLHMNAIFTNIINVYDVMWRCEGLTTNSRIRIHPCVIQCEGCSTNWAADQMHVLAVEAKRTNNV